MLQVAGLLLVFLHHKAGRPYVGIVLGIFLIDRLVYRLCIKSTTDRAYAKVMEDGQTVTLSTTLALQRKPGILSLVGRSIKSDWQPTDHVFATVPALGQEHIIQAHPFTIASAPPIARDDEARLDLLIRAQSGFSRDLLKHVQLHDRLTLRLDGPYGSSHAQELLEDSDLALVVAGGSGIAVAWPLIRHLVDISRSNDAEIPSTSSIRRQKIILIWVIHKDSHASWLGKEELAEVERQGVEVVLPRATEEVGRPDLEGLINSIVNKLVGSEGKKIGVVASRPDSMGRLVRNTCSRLARNGGDIDVTVEKFGW